ncbi:A-kinase anchor protein 17B [Microcaecilia unicolor]|uniref:A-kinase anchor protein 17B n=1 Tax=Microcaecilia unicolor TaxID=1415580 RepID=A0A6P7YTB5_9AMPH|nr:A-kinase anchor protein 17B [Microcaecilia unicolor]XP_030066476.1 A-kinase anchor protein 17B [Microcaecilia unicolor]XP_030066478.1 A-kinase anchor protein 17B [Microcaecilia unicolor]XP_030066479.1 A-kinase anchor protein 17B [Microcaecilia unicolor]
MTVTIVYDNSEAVELCTSQSLYLTPVARLIISVMFPDCKEPTRPFSNWDILDQLKTMIAPDQFSSLRVSKSTKDFVRIEGEAETKHLAQTLLAKLHGKVIKLNGFLDGLVVETTEASVDFPTQQDWEAFSKETANEELSEQSSASLPDSIYLEGLPSKWFVLKGSNSEKPSEAALQMVFERYGKVKNTDIPMLDPYREENASGNSLGGIQTFAAFVQYEDHADFVKAMEALRGMKLMYQGEDGKALACNMKVTFDTTKHFSEEAIKKRNLERQKLQELEQQRKLEKEEEEAAARKRKYEEKKAQARKRKARLKRKEQRQRQKERQEKQLKVSQEVKAEGEQWLEESEEWEARKLLLAQRRVASIRLLTLLLAQIKEFVELNRMNEELLLDIEMEDEFCHELDLNEVEKKEGTLSPPADEGWQTEVKSKCLLSRKRKSRKSEKKEKGDETGMSASSSRSLRIISKEHVKKETLIENKQNGSSGCTSLQITFNRDCKEIHFFDREDYHICHISHPRKVPEPGSGKKPKVYETDEFIHYLLNYYQCPSYARVRPEPSDTGTSSWWQRVVFHSGKGFKVLLKNTYERHFTQLNVERKTAQSVYCNPQEDDYRNWKFTIGRPDRDSDSKACVQGFSKNEFQRQWSPEELAEPCGSPRPAPGHSMGRSPGQDPLRKRNSKLSYESMSSAFELRDVLEEISSDSEYFSEERSGSERKRKGGFRSKENTAVRNRVCAETEKPRRSYPQNPESRKHDSPDLILPFGFPHQEGRNLCQCQLRRSCRHEEQNSKSGSSQEEEITTCIRKKRKGLQATDLGDDDPCFEPEYWESSRPEAEWGNTLRQKTTVKFKPKAALTQKTPSQYRISSRVLDLWDSEYMHNKEDTNDCVKPATWRQPSERSQSYYPNHSVGKRTSGSCPKSFREVLQQGHCFYST